MADGTGIEWAEATWNPITGCSIISPGCRRCYAMKLAGGRLRNHPSRKGLTIDTPKGPVWNGDVRFNDDWLTQPLHWRNPRVIFICAHADLFYDGVPDEWITRILAVVAMAPQHTFILLTKRSDRAREYLAGAAERVWYQVGETSDEWRVPRLDGDPVIPALAAHGAVWGGEKPWPLVNLWVGASIEDQRRAEARLPHLAETPAALRLVSAEPLLEQVDLSPWLAVERIQLRGRPHWTEIIDAPSIGWVIAGGESGPNARWCDPAWIRLLRDQCVAAEVPFFFKQWGRWYPAELIRTGEDGEVWRRWHDGSEKWSIEEFSIALAAGAVPVQYADVGKKKAGRLLDGRKWSQMPERLGVPADAA